jgi:hypothetical protein
VPVEHGGDRLARRGDERGRASALLLEQGPQLGEGVERERPPLAVLRGADVETHHASGEVHAVPREWEHFGANAPAREVAEADHGMEVVGLCDGSPKPVRSPLLHMRVGNGPQQQMYRYVTSMPRAALAESPIVRSLVQQVHG